MLVFGVKSRKRGTEFGAMLDLVLKKTILKIGDVGKCQYFAFFVYTAYTVVTLFKGYFPESAVLKLLECCYFFIFLAP